MTALAASPAGAFEGHVAAPSFGSPGSGAGQVSSPAGIAVNSVSHDTYVADPGNYRVDEFEQDGGFVRAWGWGVAGGLGFESCSLLSCQQGIPGSGPGQFETPTFVAVDNSGGPSEGDVYVADGGDGLVSKFDASGKLITTWGKEGQLDGTSATAEGFGLLAGIAVDASGTLDVFENEGETGDLLFQFAQDGTFSTDFTTPRGTISAGLAVDGAGDFFKVNGDGSVEEAVPAGGDIGAVTLPPAVFPTGLAVDLAGGGLYVDTGTSIGHYEFDGSGDVVEPDGSVCTLAPFTGCAQTDSFGSGVVTGGAGVGVDSSDGTVYVADAAAGRIEVFKAVTLPDVTTGSASSVQPTSAVLSGHVAPAGAGNVTSCEFEYGTDTSYGQSAPCSPAPPYQNATDVSAGVAGLRVNTTYHFRLHGGNANGTNQGTDQTFTTPGPPAVGEQSATGIEKTKATFNAEVNPDGLDTTYHFEYGLSTAYGTSAPVPDGDIGSGFGNQEASVEVEGLQSGVTYHWRIVAVNSQGTVDGADQTLTTVPPARIDSVTISNISAGGATLQAQVDSLGAAGTTYRFEYGTSTNYGTSIPKPDADIGSGSVSQSLSGLESDMTYHVRLVAVNSFGTVYGDDHTFVYDTSGGGLPDKRAYEMVTPPQKNGALVGHVFIGFNPDFSEDGSRLIISAIQCFGGAESCTASREFEGEPFEFTRTPHGWVTIPMAPSAASTAGINTAWNVSADASRALFSIPTAPGGEDDWYAREPDGAFEDIGPTDLPTKHGVLNISPEAHYATDDLSHIVWETLEYDGWPYDPPSNGKFGAVYEYAGKGNSQPLPVGVSGGAGSTNLISSCGTKFGQGGEGTDPASALSADGRIVYFTAYICASVDPSNPRELFARIDGERSDAHTVEISARSPHACTTQECETSSHSRAFFQAASTDGSKVVFTTTQKLTDSASEDDTDVSECERTTGLGGCNLYLYDFANPSGDNLVDVSAGDTSGLGPQVKSVIAVSPDGSHVYFLANGVLASGASPGNCQSAAGSFSGTCNLYVYERDGEHPDGRIGFVVKAPFSHGPKPRDANITPDGRFLVFTSRGRLTPDVTRSEGPDQVFRYDAQTGELVRVSIGQDGFDDNGNAGIAGAEIALSGTFDKLVGPSRLDPTMSHDGAYVFFESADGLTPQALNDVPIESGRLAKNIYEYHDGQVYLISDGKDVATAAHNPAVELLGTDATGANVFFTTADKLVPTDTDTQLDYYDARVCEESDPCISSPPPPLSPCLGEVCHGTPASQPLVPNVPSATFNGQGNLIPQAAVKTKKAGGKKSRACPKGKKHHRGKCVKVKRAKSKKAKSHKGGK